MTGEICAAFVDEDSEQTRAQAYRDWAAWREKNPFFEPQTEDQWNKLYPLGYFEYVEAIGPDGQYGDWLRSLPVAVKIDETIFLHGGIGPDYLDQSIQKINKKHFEVQEALDTDRAFLVRQGSILPFFTLAELNQALIGRIQQRDRNAAMSEREKWMFNKTARDLSELGRLLDADSPLWFRGYHSLDDEGLSSLVHSLNKSYGTEHYVVAHTVQPSATISQRLGASIFLIDTGMLSSHYGGRPSALEIIDGRFTAIYPEDRSVLHEAETGGAYVPAVSRQPDATGLLETLSELALAQPPYVGGDDFKWPGRDGEALPFQNHAEIKHFLNNAAVADIEDIPVGVTKPKKVTLQMNGVTAYAAFRDVNIIKERQRMADGTIAMFFRDNYKNEVAAYELGLALGFTNIPPAVLRTIDGAEGSLQLWVEGPISEKERMAEGKSAPDKVRWRRQIFDMDVFDALINNLDRNQGNILWDADWNLWMIDHTRSFGRDPKVRKRQDVQMVSQSLYDAIQGLDPKQVKEMMKPYMSGMDAGGLMKRQKNLLQILDELIESQGKDSVIFNYE